MTQWRVSKERSRHGEHTYQCNPLLVLLLH
jgi:hypothetical protein